jgi:hypothetical protein
MKIEIAINVDAKGKISQQLTAAKHATMTAIIIAINSKMNGDVDECLSDKYVQMNIVRSVATRVMLALIPNKMLLLSKKERPTIKAIEQTINTLVMMIILSFAESAIL